jgi:glycosyltransferase A (GT-A) superfamily protein (DUF2064 family)
LFVKTPGLSPVKTRLATSLAQACGYDAMGAQRVAERLYRACLRAVEQSLRLAQRRWPGLHVYYAVAEAAAMNHRRWRRWPRLWQGDGDLGDRQSAIHAALLERHRGAVLVGSDLPWLGRTQLDPALQALANGEPLVIGPSADGGYYLLGASVAVGAEVYKQVEYSQPDTLSRLLGVLPATLRPHLLASLHDLDQWQDVADLLASAPNHPDRAQRRLQRQLRQCQSRCAG